MDQAGLDKELEQLQQVYQMVTEFLVNYSFQLIGAAFIFLLGLWVAAKISNLIKRKFETHQIDQTLGNFVSNLVRVLIIIMAGIIALGKLGISITPMVAAIGAASLGAGLAIQGMLSNYAAGVTIIVTRPFVIGDTIEVKGVTGVVEDIHLGFTELSNEDGEKITIPNKHIVGEILHNSAECKLVETRFTVSYQTDADQLTSLIHGLLSDAPQVATDRGIQVGINDFNPMGMEIGVRYLVPTATYHRDKYETNMMLHRQLKQANIEMACPLREIHVPPGGHPL
ncbi:mechanosensitive ion channel family protein [Shewanella corallii]|uniref:Small-conductance mechanosensitive channel n=1 Tax=Shewanella corallii TaxID=560080 RepID=A0ABT0N880_9GAMM|nr:mechanosensitive ion channel family protein [Shewanella corallii]MCL2914663.1 mechanosensitive ion channel family protein [Shewanella corallii]